MMIRVLIADDHQLARKALQALLQRADDIEIVGEARDGQQAVELAQRVHPDIVLMDMAMPGLSGLRAVEQMQALHPRPQVVIISMYSDEGLVRDALHKGARGYLLKQSTFTELVQAIRAVHSGKTFLGSEVADFTRNSDLV